MQNVIDSAQFIGGHEVSSFSKNFADFHGEGHVICVANGTDALEIAIEALQLPQNSEIIVPANSFIATAEAVTRNGFKVVFCDVDENTYTMSPNSLKNKISNKTSAIIPVHLYGHPCDMDEILKIASDNNLQVIEDCAQAHGALYKGRKVGTFGDLSCFSFYPGKNLGAFGDAGAIFTNQSDLAEKCRLISNHGRIEKYNHKIRGRNSRMDALQAAVLNVKLKYLEDWNSKRIKLAARYVEGLKHNNAIVLPDTKPWAKHIFHLFVIRVQGRDKLQKELGSRGIQTGVHYPIALPKLEAFEDFGQSSSTNFSTQTDNYLISLPMGPHLSSTDVDTVCLHLNQLVV
jgi:dTDP-4-amino-4,6-dideoxygalactose transaminase